jgi:hypothetical protein
MVIEGRGNVNQLAVILHGLDQIEDTERVHLSQRFLECLMIQREGEDDRFVA